MGEQRNLTEENVDELKKELNRMQQDNPDLEYRFFEQKDQLSGTVDQEEEQPSNRMIFEKLEAIENKLTLIFGDHVLLKGEFYVLPKM